jgi:DNA/RNA-binding domain of Phe-tRNA-synthetase-like protein/drug/metabolite transporter (DMT)-like permease
VGGSVAVSSALAGAPVFTAEAVRYAVACLLLVALARVTGRRLSVPRGTEWLWRSGIAVTGLVVFNLALVKGSQHAEPAVLGVAVACVPSLLAVIGPLLEGSSPRPSLVAAALLITCGAALVQGLGRTDAIGVAWAAVVFGCEAGFTLLAIPVLGRHGPWGVSVHATWLAAVIFAAGAMAREGPAAAARLSRPNWLAVVYLAVAVTAAAFVMWYSSVRRLGASRAGLLTGVAPVAAAATGVLLGGPAPGPLVWAGVAVVGVGLAQGFLGNQGSGGGQGLRGDQGSRAGQGLRGDQGSRGRSGLAKKGGLMHFQHSAEIWRDFPALVPGVLYAEGITSDVSADARAGRFAAIAASRLADGSESEWPEIQAWRRAFAKTGLKPTQYRCAAESLLRRFRKEGSLPRLHPLVDLCNAVSLAFAVPVAVFDIAKITWPLKVRHAAGDEDYLTFAGDIEHPAAGEVIFADQAGRAHARRWTNRQSGLSAVQDSTAAVLIVAEALHDSAACDVRELTSAIAGEVEAVWSVAPSAAVLTRSSPRFAFGA